MSVESLESRLGYRFNNRALLMTALTHPSYGADHQTKSYQRMEFLGDAVLELAVSRHLYLNAPKMDEGQLSRRRASLVCEETLSEIAREYDIGAHIRFSHGEEKSGGQDKPSILADVFEAILASVYLDGGMDEALALVDRAFEEMFTREEGAFDAKTHLQERLQKNRAEAPVYETLGRSGPDHEPVFSVRVMSGGKELARGEGRSKQAAQQNAARTALKRMNK